MSSMQPQLMTFIEQQEQEKGNVYVVLSHARMHPLMLKIKDQGHATG